MRNIKFPILGTTCYLLIYTLLSEFGAGIELMLPLFILSPLLVIWMVIRVLKDGQPSEKKFSDGHWYEDSDYHAIPD